LIVVAVVIGGSEVIVFVGAITIERVAHKLEPRMFVVSGSVRIRKARITIGELTGKGMFPRGSDVDHVKRE